MTMENMHYKSVISKDVTGSLDTINIYVQNEFYFTTETLVVVVG